MEQTNKHKVEIIRALFSTIQAGFASEDL